jgi:hypothetical protein
VKTNVAVLLLAGGLALAVPAVAAAQQADPLVRGDLSGTIGWLAVSPAAPLLNPEWANSLYGTGAAGWYWTDHLKTEIEFVTATEGRMYGHEQRYVNGISAFRSIESSLSRRTLALGQHYQFFRNAWLHPYVGAGLAVTWERRTDDYDPLLIWDDPRGQPRLLEPPRREGPRTRTAVTAFVQSGFKAYMTPRTFFRADLRVGFDDRFDTTQLGAGFGFDF